MTRLCVTIFDITGMLTLFPAGNTYFKALHHNFGKSDNPNSIFSVRWTTPTPQKTYEKFNIGKVTPETEN